MEGYDIFDNVFEPEPKKTKERKHTATERGKAGKWERRRNLKRNSLKTLISMHQPYQTMVCPVERFSITL